MAQQTSLNDNLPLNTISIGTGADITGNRVTATNDHNNAESKLLDGNGNKTDGAAMSMVADLIPDPMAQIPGAPPDFNVYRNKKTLTQGLMDLALFSANANQLRYVLENGNTSAASYFIAAFLIILSLILQALLIKFLEQGRKILRALFVKIRRFAPRQGPVACGEFFYRIAVGLILLMSIQYNVTVQCQRKICYKYGNYASMGIFLVTVVNVFIVAFGEVSPMNVPRNKTIS